MLDALKRAGFTRWEVVRTAGRGSNILIVAPSERPRQAAGL